MRLVTKKSVDEIRQVLFSPLHKAANTNRPWTEVAPTWCTLSQTRLFSKIIEYKPAGAFKHQHLGLLTDYLNHIYEDEDFDCEDYLSPEDVATIKKRREKKEDDEIMRFEPVYRIRPTVQQVIQKLGELYDMNTIEEYEDNPDWLEKSSEFFLPEGEFSELIQEQETRIFAAPPLEMKTPRHSGAPPAKKRRRRQSTDSGSRASSISKHETN